MYLTLNEHSTQSNISIHESNINKCSMINLELRTSNPSNSYAHLFFLKCSEQTTVEFVMKKPSFPCCRLIRLHHLLLCSASFGKWKKWKCAVSRLRHKMHSTSKSGTLFAFSFSRSSRATLSGVCVVHSQEKSLKHSRTSRNLSSSYNTSQPPPRYRVCAVTFPIWRQELEKGLLESVLVTYHM